MFGDTLAQLRKYDVMATNGDTVYTYECKRDRLAKETGNVAVEHKALKHSEADFVVYLLDGQDQLLRIHRERLWAYLEDNWSKGDKRPWRVVRGGEFRDWMTLIPVREFIGLCSAI
jgi:hypothetical protein